METKIFIRDVKLYRLGILPELDIKYKEIYDFLVNYISGLQEHKRYKVIGFSSNGNSQFDYEMRYYLLTKNLHINFNKIRTLYKMCDTIDTLELFKWWISLNFNLEIKNVFYV